MIENTFFQPKTLLNCRVWVIGERKKMRKTEKSLEDDDHLKIKVDTRLRLLLHLLDSQCKNFTKQKLEIPLSTGSGKFIKRKCRQLPVVFFCNFFPFFLRRMLWIGQLTISGQPEKRLLGNRLIRWQRNANTRAKKVCSLTCVWKFVSLIQAEKKVVSFFNHN